MTLLPGVRRPGIRGTMLLGDCGRKRSGFKWSIGPGSPGFPSDSDTAVSAETLQASAAAVYTFNLDVVTPAAKPGRLAGQIRRRQTLHFVLERHIDTLSRGISR